MSANEHLEDDDLALYALGLLSAPESEVIARRLSADSQSRRRAANMQMALGTYAETTVTLQPVPSQSLGRLMGAIRQEKELAQEVPSSARTSLPRSSAPVLSFPATSLDRDAPAKTGTGALSWFGWALAAALLIAAGLQFRQGSALRQTLAQQTAAAQSTSQQVATLSRERDALQSELQERSRQAQQANADTDSLKQQAAELRMQAAGQLSKAQEQGAIAQQATNREQQASDQAQRATDQAQRESARAQEQSARAASLAAAAEESARERDALKNTLDAQARQTAALNAQAASAKQVLQALTDPTAQRVTLTIPKEKVAPTGRATYVASNGTLIFTASHLATLEANKVYELWLLPTGGANPVPAGTFAPDASGNASLVATKFARGAAKGFAVTIENAGGAQTPTLPILLAGT